MTIRALVVGILAGLACIAWACSAHAAIAITELTVGGNATGSIATVNTASVSPTAGATLIVISFHNNNHDCHPVNLSGLGATWTERDILDTITYNYRLWSAVSDGTSGVLTFTCTDAVIGRWFGIGWIVLQATGVVSATNDGVVSQSHDGFTTATSPSLVKSFPAYTRPSDAQISYCACGGGPSGSATFTGDPDPGWATGSTSDTGNNQSYVSITPQWLLVRGSDTASNCSMNTSGNSETCHIATLELLGPLGAVPHRVRNQ